MMCSHTHWVQVPTIVHHQNTVVTALKMIKAKMLLAKAPPTNSLSISMELGSAGFAVIVPAPIEQVL